MRRTSAAAAGAGLLAGAAGCPVPAVAAGGAGIDWNSRLLPKGCSVSGPTGLAACGGKVSLQASAPGTGVFTPVALSQFNSPAACTIWVLAKVLPMGVFGVWSNAIAPCCAMLGSRQCQKVAPYFAITLFRTFNRLRNTP